MSWWRDRGGWDWQFQVGVTATRVGSGMVPCCFGVVVVRRRREGSDVVVSARIEFTPLAIAVGEGLMER